MLVVFFGQDCTGVVDACTMVLLPDLADAGGRFPFDHGDLHDLAELPRAGVGEGHLVGHSLQHSLL